MCAAQMAIQIGNGSDPDPRLIECVGAAYAEYHGVYPLRRVGALTLVAARDMWARLDTVDCLEERLGPVAFVDLSACQLLDR